MALSDIFKAYDIRGKTGSDLNPTNVYRIGQVFANWLPTKGAVVVGHDMRVDSAELADNLIKGITSQGRDVWDIGLCTSEMVYFAPGKFDLAGGAMITASHNPGEYNGIKFCREKALPVGIESGLDVIRDRVLTNQNIVNAKQPGQVIKKDLLDTWVDHVVKFVDPKTIKPFHVAVDAGNGMSGLTVPKLAEKLPIKIDSLFFELDGTFPNHEANPMKVETLSAISKLIVDNQLDFGIAFDGDADRMALIDENGQPLTGSMTCALLCQYVLAKYPNANIVHDLRMSRSTIDFIKSHGGQPIRGKVGNTYLKQAGRDNNAAFGGEITGHFMFRDNYFVDSGLLAALIAVQVLSEADFTLSQFVERYDTYCHTPEINLETNDPPAILRKIAEAFPDGQADWLDGLTIEYPDSIFNIRPSNTEPVMRFNIEAKTEPRLNELVARVKQLVQDSN